MAKKSVKSTKVFVDKKFDKTVSFGKYKDKPLLWVAQNDLDFFKEIETLYYSQYNLTKQQYYDRLKKQFVQNQGLIITSALQETVHEVVVLMKQRKTSGQLHSYLTEDCKLSKDTAIRIVIDANALIRKEFELEKNFLLDIHLLRYEELFESNMNPDLSKVPAGYRRAVECENRYNAMETLFQKEKMLGIHTKKFKQQFNSLTPKLSSNIEFDMKKLNSSEQLELLGLLNRAKPVEQLIRPITPNLNPLDVDISKYTDSVEVIEAPIKEAKQTDVIGDEQNKEMEGKGKSLEEVQQSMGRNLEEEIKKAFEKMKNNKK